MLFFFFENLMLLEWRVYIYIYVCVCVWNNRERELWKSRSKKKKMFFLIFFFVVEHFQIHFQTIKKKKQRHIHGAITWTASLCVPSYVLRLVHHLHWRCDHRCDGSLTGDFHSQILQYLSSQTKRSRARLWSVWGNDKESDERKREREIIQIEGNKKNYPCNFSPASTKHFVVFFFLNDVFFFCCSYSSSTHLSSLISHLCLSLRTKRKNSFEEKKFWSFFF